MAVNFKVENTRTSVYDIDPSLIKFNPHLNGRHELPDIEWLVKSFLRHGQLEPVLIRNDGGTPVLAMGFSRLRAALEINKRKLTPKPFRLKCVYLRASEQEGFMANVAENLERNNTTAIDDGHNMARMGRYGMTAEEIAEFYHPKDEFGNLLDAKRAVKWVNDRLALVSLAPESQAAVKNGKVKPSAVQALTKLSQEQQREAVKNGKTVTAASVKAVASNGSGRAAKAPANPLKALRAVLSNVIESGEMPNGLDVSKMKPEDAVHAVCGVLIDLIGAAK